jgi:hypothetical protein
MDKMGVDRNYYVAKAMTVSYTPFAQSSQRLQALENAYGAAAEGRVTRSNAGRAPGMPGGMPGSPDMMMPPGMMMDPAMGMMPPGMSPATGGRNTARPGIRAGDKKMTDVDPDAPYKDRLTGEDVRQDSEVRILLAVVVDPPPKKAESPQP